MTDIQNWDALNPSHLLHNFQLYSLTHREIGPSSKVELFMYRT